MTFFSHIEYMFVHTAASTATGVTVADIDRWHKARGWSGIGYHVVIQDDGLICYGRPMFKTGAHVFGLNGKSIGICVTGHGDKAPFNDAQTASLIRFVTWSMMFFDIPIDRILGHREINDLVDAGIVKEKFRTSKTCPGTEVDMDDLRVKIAAYAREVRKIDPLNPSGCNCSGEGAGCCGEYK